MAISRPDHGKAVYGSMGIVVAKFGGSSLADATQFRKVKNILLADENRMYVVPSAPGRRDSDDVKVTDIKKAFTEDELKNGIVLKRGKKNFNKVVLK